MDFSNAIRQVIDGKKITRRAWNDIDTFVYLADFLMIHNSKDIDGGVIKDDHDLILHKVDILAFDWVVVQ